MIFQICLIAAILVISIAVTSHLKIIKNVMVAGIAVVIAAIIIGLGWTLVKQDKLSYNEYWNGYEVQAVWNKTGCDRDSGCKHTYNCDPYQVYHPAVIDGKGDVISSAYYTTEYHSCPYTTEEWQFIVKTTLGDYEIASANLPTDPDNHRYRVDTAVPSGIPAGIPAFWQAADNRIRSGSPGPVTKRMQYDNYLLASDTTILNQYSDKIKDFLAAGILPKVVNNTHDYYYADKVYFVNYVPTEDWFTPAAYVDAAFGTELQGDLHIVIVQNTLANNNPEAYLEALKAYWTDNKVFGKNTLSKNGLLIIIGTTDGKTVAWAKAITGMPLGNEALLQGINQKLTGAQLSPGTILGNMKGEFYQKADKIKVRAVHDKGLLDDLIWGVTNPATRFTRISMSANDKTDNGSGFAYLSDQVQPDDTQQFFIGILALLLGAFWLIVLYWWEKENQEVNSYEYHQ